MAEGYDVEIRLEGKDGLSRVVKKSKTAVDRLSAAADPKAKRHFMSFSLSAVASLRVLRGMLNIVRRGLRGIQSAASSAFRRISRGAKMAALAAAALAVVLVKWGAAVIEAENLFRVSMGKMVKEAE